jgi:hypothetical protein
MTYINIRPGFNGIGTLNLESFNVLHPKVLPNGTFIKYVWIDLDAIDLNDIAIIDNNIGIRPLTGNDEQRIMELRNSFKANGWMTTEFPPIVDSNGKFWDGRGRAIAAKANGERWLPGALYSFSSVTFRNQITCGLLANDGLPSNPTNFGGFLCAGVALIAAGELDRDEAEIKNWLYNEAKVEQFIDNSICGGVTKLINAILRDSETGGNIILNKGRNFWQQFSKEAGCSDPVLLSVDSDTYPLRAYGKILQDPDTIPEIVLYTGKAMYEDDFVDAIRKTVDALEDYWKCTFDLVNSSIEGVQIKAPQNKPWKIAGVAPQIVGKHDKFFNKRKLVKLNQL